MFMIGYGIGKAVLLYELQRMVRGGADSTDPEFGVAICE